MSGPDRSPDHVRSVWVARMVGLVALALVAIAVVRIIATYGVISQTWDEPAHVATGMEWLQRGTYTYERQHPPLARVAVALGPYLKGIRLPESRADADLEIPEVFRRSARMWREGNLVLYDDGEYEQNLAVARLGVIPFFLLGAVILWLWTARLFDRTTALIAVLLYSTSPNILAHAGVATTDMAVTATLLAALYTFALWLEEPGWKRGLWLGLATGAAVISKFSAIAFIPACVVAVMLTRWVVEGKGLRQEIVISRLPWRSAGLALFAALVVAWAAYRFSLDPLPLTELVDGIEEVANHQSSGHRSYLLGEVAESGWWYYYPVAIAVKTPIPLLVLVGIGLALIVTRARREGAWQLLAPPVCAVAVIAVMAASNVNIGLRHILPAYPLLMMVGAHAARETWRSGRTPARVVVGVLLGWQLVTSALAHPDYLAYFNELAAHEPREFLIQGDLDWGQDLGRLARRLDELHVDSVWVAYAGSGDPNKHLDQHVRYLRPRQRAHGWIAISVWRLESDGTPAPPYDGYSWLEAYAPRETVGRSILLYRLPPPAERGGGGEERP